MSEIAEKIGDRVQRIRKSVGYTQEELSEKTGIGIESISRIERGVQGVTFENIERIAQAFDVPFRDLCDIDEENEEIQKAGEIRDIVRMLEDASPYEVQFIHTMIQEFQRWFAEDFKMDS